MRRADHQAFLREDAIVTFARFDFGNAEIKNLDLLNPFNRIDEPDIIGLQVTMNDALHMCRMHGVTGLQDHRQGFSNVELPLLSQMMSEVCALKEFHNQISDVTSMVI